MNTLNPLRPSPPRYFARHGAAILTNGYNPLPVRPFEKRTFVSGWSRFCAMPPTAATVARWAALPTNYGLALACGYACVAIDLDEDDPERLAQLYALALAVLGPTPLVRRGNPPRCVLLYRPATPGMPSRRLGAAVEVLGKGRYVVAFGIHPKAAKPYAWKGPGPQEVSAADLPAVTEAMIEAFAQAVSTQCYYAISGQSVPVDASPAHVRKPVLPGRPHLPPRPASKDARWPLDADGKICDGRDSYLAALVCRHFCRGVTDGDALTDAAWAEFERTASLERAKRDGGAPWCQADARAKAVAIIRKANRRPGVLRASVPRPGYWTQSRLSAFCRLVDNRGALGHLSPVTVRVSHAMAGFVRGDGTCFASPETLAELARCSVRSAKAARQTLVTAQLWHVSNNRGGRARGADYAPCRDAFEAASGCDIPWANSERIAHPIIPVGGGTITANADRTRIKKRRENQPGVPLGDLSGGRASPEYRAARRSGAEPGVVEVPFWTAAIPLNREGER